jgi:hypothetical protein
MRLPAVAVDFAGAIKGLRSVASMQDALDTTLANAKITADAASRAIRTNVAAFKDKAAGYEFLFADLGQIVNQAADHFALTVQARIDAHKAAEQRRIDAERERIRAEEVARIEREVREAAAKAEAERVAALSTLTPPAAPATAAQLPLVPTGVVLSDKPVADANARAFVERIERIIDEPATLKLGTIGDRLGFILTSAFIADALAIKPAKVEGASKLYRDSDFGRICQALQQHVGEVARKANNVLAGAAT